jgi:small redox-active disulfide protein 2
MKKLQVYGTGCPKCKQLAQVAEEAAKELGIEYELEKVTDINKIVQSGIMGTPALSVDGEVKVTGKVPSKEEMKTIIG